MKIRSALVPVVNLVTRIAYVLFIISLLFQYMGGLYAAVVIVALGLVFQLVTLPVEFNASSRALKKIDEYKIVTKNEHDGTKKMLFAAAMTYVAALLSDVLNLARLLIQVGDRNKRR